MDLGLKDKVALVTGSTSGIGKAVAEALAAEGANVAVTGQEMAKAKEAAMAIGKQAAPFAADLTDAGSVQTLVNDVVARFGTVHVLVNVAGGVAKFGSFDDASDDDWQKDFDLNVMSAVRVTRAVLPHMRRLRWGRIVNIASEDGIQPYPEVPSYATGKAALLALTKSLSKLCAKDGILVNTVSPAFVMTPLVKRMLDEKAKADGSSFDEAKDKFLAEKRPHIELKRPGEPHEIAAAVAFLVSEKASFILGENLRVDGGSVPTIGA